MSRDNDLIKNAIQAALLKDRPYWNPEQDRSRPAAGQRHLRPET